MNYKFYLWRFAMNFDLYRTFYYVGKYQSITAASKALFVTQPSVTHAIQLLEQELNCTLFIRSQKGVRFTPEGEQFYQAVSKACETIFQAERALEASKTLSEGRITIGASETTLHHYLMPYLVAFKKKHPNIRLKLYNANTPEMLKELNDETIDFAVLVLEKDYRDDALSITHLTDFEDIFIANDDFEALKGPSVSLQTLADYPLITMERTTMTRHFLDEFFLSHGLPLEPDIELATTDLIVPMVRGGLGIGIVPDVFAKKAMASGEVFRIHLNEPLPRRDICLIKKKKASLSLASEAFITYLLSDIQ